MSTTKEPSLQEWRSVYEAATQLKKLAPWEWMEEVDLFGVQHPETGEIAFVSVMGMLGEHYAVSVYLGTRALDQFWGFQDAGPMGSPEMLMEIPQLQASFENRQELEDKDYKTIKKLGLKFRGKHAWPMFRTIRPGCLPWFMEADEVRFLRYALEQAVDVTPRFNENPDLFDVPDDESYLVRVPRREGKKLVWEDQIMRIESPEPQDIDITMDLDALESLQRLPKSAHKIEADFFMLPAPIQEGDRPFFPYILLMADSKSGMVVGTEIFSPLPSLEEMWGNVPMNFVTQLVNCGICPKEVKVRSPLLADLLEPLCDEVGFKLKISQRLKSLDAAMESLFQQMMPPELMDELFSEDAGGL